MTFGYQQQYVLESTAARAAISTSTRGTTGCTPPVTAPAWLATFKHTGATLTVGGRLHRPRSGVRRRRGRG